MATLTYKKSGVDIDEADDFIRKIKPLIRQTTRPEVLGQIGGFGGLFQPRLGRMKNPVLVSSTDGVGTKLLLADLLGKHDTVGQDLVAMCVDDVVVTGAEPLFFLDYIACGRLKKDKLLALMRGMTRACREAGCALIGGETAELPGLYSGEKYDLAGFCVGVVDRDRIVDGSGCRPGDKIIGLASSGVHSNGFSLARKVFNRQELLGPVGRELLKPTRIYTRIILEVMKKVRIKAMAHITGGGLVENIPRVLPPGSGVRIEKGSWPVPAIFRKIQERGNIEEQEMFRTFNMGIGMALILSPRSASKALDIFTEKRQKSWIIGEVIEGEEGPVFGFF
jgi:phosphoribosylformylglycinamidine cyclo-ligase